LKLDLPPTSLPFSDEALVRDIVSNNNIEYFNILYDRYYPFIYGQCMLYFKNPQDAEDVTQEIFFKLYKKLDTFAFKSRFFTWLYRLVHNHCINHQRGTKHRRLENKSINPENLSDYFFSYNYETNGANDYKLARLKRAILVLPVEDQQILVLKYCGGETIKELAERYGYGESALKMKLKRIKAKLLKHYRQIDFEHQDVVK